MKQAFKPIEVTLNESYRKQLATNEYLLILNPHEELRNKIQHLKTAFHESFHSPSAMGSKPHVTLVRFTQLALMEERIVQRLRAIAMGFCPFKVELKDFGAFPSHSIFINVTSILPVKGLLKEIRETQRLMKPDKEHKPYFVDEPHIVIGRKLLPGQFDKAWLEYSHRSFTGRFIADSMLLLKRRSGDKAWQIAERFVFQNLPVTTRQGELFLI